MLDTAQTRHFWAQDLRRRQLSQVSLLADSPVALAPGNFLSAAVLMAAACGQNHVVILGASKLASSGTVLNIGIMIVW